MPAHENDMTHSEHSDRAMSDEIVQSDDTSLPAASTDEDEDSSERGHLSVPTGPNVPE